MTKLVARFVKDESGATAIEYGLIAALIAVAIMVGARALGTVAEHEVQRNRHCGRQRQLIGVPRKAVIRRAAPPERSFFLEAALMSRIHLPGIR